MSNKKASTARRSTRLPFEATEKPRITSVTIRMNKQIAPFEHVHYEATATVPEGYNHQDVAEKLRQHVQSNLIDLGRGRRLQSGADTDKELQWEDDFSTQW